jgi:hypothetical protein
MNEFDVDIFPPDIMEKAREITRFMEEQGIVSWELGGICSRNHADKVRVYERYFEFKKENKLV